MKFESLKQEIKYLPPSRKIILGAVLGTLLSLVFPWGIRGVQGPGYEFLPEGFSAFGVFPVFGWVFLIFSVLSLALLLRELMWKKKSYFGISHAWCWMLLGGVGMYTLVVALFVFNAAYLKSFDSQFALQVSIFITLFLQILLFFGGYMGYKNETKHQLKKTLSGSTKEGDTSRAHLRPEMLENRNQMSLGDYDS